MVSLVTVLATQADGRTLVHDWLYELRLFALEQLSAMRADLFLCDPHRIIVSGPTPLRGRGLDSRDLRSGMAFIAAALAADGESTGARSRPSSAATARWSSGCGSLGAQVEKVQSSLTRRRVTADAGLAAGRTSDSAGCERLREASASAPALRGGWSSVAGGADASAGVGRRAVGELDAPGSVGRRRRPRRVRGGTAAGPLRTDPARGRCAASASG